MHLQPFPVYELLLANHKVCGEPASTGEVLCKYDFKCSKMCELSSYSMEKQSVLLCSCVL